MKPSIKLVTKDYFYKNVEKECGFEIYNTIVDEIKIILDFTCYDDIVCPYFEVCTENKNYFFSYICSLDTCIISKMYDDEERKVILNLILNSQIDLSNWKIKKVSDKPKYIKNTYLRPYNSRSYYLSLDDYQDGVYEIVNEDTNERFNFSVWTNNSESGFSSSSYIASDDKAYCDDLIECHKFEKIEQLFQIILESNGRQYFKRFDIKGE